MKKVLALIIVAAILCSGCALAAGALAGGIAREVINLTFGSGKNKEISDNQGYLNIFRGSNVPEIK